MTAADFVGRLGGLAAALGVGVVIGLATSAPASADQTDSVSRSETSADSPSSPRRSATGANTAGTATVGAGPSVVAVKAGGGVMPRSAAKGPGRVDQPAVRIPVAATPSLVVAAPTPVSSASTPASTPVATPVATPDRQVPVSPEPAFGAAATHTSRREYRRIVPTTAAVPVAGATVAGASDPRPGPIARALSALFNCDPRGRLITIYKGTHFAIPNNFGGFFVQKVQGTGTFTTDSVYDLNDEDQFDWSKFSGIAFTPLEPDRDSAMVGWRYNLTTQEFEIGPFYNVDKVRISARPSEIISVPAGETFNYLVDYTGVTLSYGDTTVFKPFPPGLTANIWTAVRVSGWFGGNEVAPRTLSYYIKFT